MPSDIIEVFVERGGKEILTDKNYIATGGEGSVYQKGGTAYKIMSPGHAIIPHKKMEELRLINSPNVLTPQDYLYDAKGKTIGFTMKYVHNVEFLCQLFNNNYLQVNKISPTDIVELVKEMQKVLNNNIHRANCLAVDFNQMNFLVDKKKFKTPYFIDTDSYQTPSFPATALMDCVRDRKATPGKFNILTDWYSWGIVTFWLYIGTHPYRGSHPNYDKKDWNGKRMDDGISVFHKEVSMPGNCRDFSVIPKPHLEWFKDQFHNNNRSIPPLADGNIIVTVAIKVKNVAQFSTTLVFEYNSNIRRVFLDDGERYVLTEDKLYKNETPIVSYFQNYENVGFIKVKGDGDAPVLAGMKDDKVVIYNWKTNEILHEMFAEDMMVSNGVVYTRCGDVLVAHNCTKMFDRVIHSVKRVANIFGSSCKFFDGVIIQDVVGKCMMAFEDDDGDFVNVPVKDLDKKRIIDAKHIRGTCVVFVEKRGVFERYVFTFSKDRMNYFLRITEADSGDSVDFLMKGNGLCIAPVGDDLETWSGQNSKIFKNSPIPSGAIMHHEFGKTMFAVGNKLYVTEKA